MQQRVFTIAENAPVARGTYRLRLMGDTAAITAPGQFVDIRLAGRFLRRQIVDPREVERNIDLFHVEAIAEFLGKTLVQILHMRVVAAVIGDDDLVIAVIRLVNN